MAEQEIQSAPQPAAPKEDVSGEQPILVWDAKEFAEYTRDKSWYLLVGLGAAIAIILLIVAQTFLLKTTGGSGSLIPDWVEYVLLVLVFGLMAYVALRHADDTPRTVTYALTKLGVQAGDKFYSYNELKTFWIIYKPPVQTLHLQGINRFRPLIKIDLGGVDPLKVKNVLKEHLPEDTNRTEDFLDKFSRMIRL